MMTLKDQLRASLAVLLALLVLAAYSPLYVHAETGAVSFIDAQGNQRQCKDYTVITDDTVSMNGGWYVSKGVSTIFPRITVTGNVDLILCNHSTMIASGGIYIQQGSSLTIWQQKVTGEDNSAGYLAATGATNNAGIGGNEDTVAGRLTVNGGRLDIRSGDDAAAIGGGYDEDSGYEAITINGGEITADSSSSSRTDGAAIGGGKNNTHQGPITINGGYVIARGGVDAAAIGGGKNTDNAPITINGGQIFAYGGAEAAAIGGGCGGSGGNITITGGSVNAYAAGTDNQGAGIGGGSVSGGGGAGGHVIITGGSIHASGYHAIGSGTGTNADSYHGTVELYNDATVGLSSGGDFVKTDNRESTCYYNREVWISPCKHPGSHYEVKDAYHLMYCNYCAIELDGPQDHQWSRSYTIDKAATYTATGIKSIHCALCDGIRKDSLTAIPKVEKVDLPKVTILKPAASKKAATVKWKKLSKANQKKIAKIQIQYSKDKNFRSGVKTVYSKKSLAYKKIKKLTSKKNYYIRIRAFKQSGGVTHVSRWSAVKRVKAK